MDDLRLYKLEPLAKRDTENDPWDPWFDKCFGMIIAARDEVDARRYADSNMADEQGFHSDCHPWLDAALSSCAEVDLKTAGVLMQDIRYA